MSRRTKAKAKFYDTVLRSVRDAWDAMRSHGPLREAHIERKTRQADRRRKGVVK